jgi:hypothetical protein
MLRTMILAAFTLGASTISLSICLSPGAAFAQPRAQRSEIIQSPLGQEVRSDDGKTVLGRVSHVSRDHTGRIVAVEIPGLEPGDAPRASVNAIAQNDRSQSFGPASFSRQGGAGAGGLERTSR